MGMEAQSFDPIYIGTYVVITDQEGKLKYEKVDKNVKVEWVRGSELKKRQMQP